MSNGRLIEFPRAAREEPSERRLIRDRLKDARLAKRLSQTDLASSIGVSRQAISAYEAGTKFPEPDTLARISEKLEQPTHFFLREDAALFGELSTRFFRAFGPSTKRRNLMCDVMSKWLAQTATYLDNYVNFPQVNLIDVEPTASDGRYTDEEIENAAEHCRKAWGLGFGPISDVIGLLESKGIVTCRLQVPGEKLDAFAYWSGSKPFVFLASDKSSSARSRFDAAHELGHLVLHRFISDEDLDDRQTLKVIESEANKFAGAFLLPRKTFPSEVYTPRLTAFIELKRRWKVSIQAMIYRCKLLGIFDDEQVTKLYKQISYNKWKTKEPLDDIKSIPFEQPKLLNRALRLIVDNQKKSPDELCVEIGLGTNLVEQLCSLEAGYLSPTVSPRVAPTLKDEAFD